MNGVAALDTGDSHRHVTAGSMSLARSVKAESSVIVDGERQFILFIFISFW